MSPGDLVFGKPVLLQSYTGKTLVNGTDMKAVVSTSAPEEADCVVLVRNDDGTVSIQSMRNNLYLSVKDEEEDEEDDRLCFFNAKKIEETETFVLKLLDECTFSLKSEDLGFEMERIHDEVVCKRHSKIKAPSMLWVMTAFIPPSGSPSETLSLVHADAAIVCDNAASRAEEALTKRHDIILSLAMAGKSVEFIDDILERLYGVTAVSADGKALE